MGDTVSLAGTSVDTLLGREREVAVLKGVVAAAKGGRSHVLVVRGEAGVGKTVLLERLVDEATGCSVARTAGVESGLELAFAGLHQVCSPYLDRLGRLPSTQQTALSTALGLVPGAAPDRFLVGLAVLTLFADVAEERPLMCVVDDAQWLDQASLQALELVARRLGAESVALVFATRDGGGPRLSGLPELVVTGLAERDAGALLDASVSQVLDRRVRDRILAESNGNPLALVELPRMRTATGLAFGGDAWNSAVPVAHRLEQAFAGKLESLPDQSRTLLLLAAAEPTGDAALLWRAAQQLGIEPREGTTVDETGLLHLEAGVRFRHPLVRSAVYRAATDTDRRAVHRALADATDPQTDPDRRAWHRGQSTVDPDEAVAAELEQSAGRAMSHGGLAAAAALLERAAELTPDARQRSRRCLDAAQAKIGAGAFDDAANHLGTAELGPIGEPERARIELHRAQLLFASSRGNEASVPLLSAARRLEALDAGLARDTYLDALAATLFAGRLAVGADARQVAQAARTAPASAEPRKRDVLLDGLVLLHTDGYRAAVPTSRRAVQAFCDEDLSIDEALRFSWLAASTAVGLWDDVAWDVLTQRHLDFARQSGALGALPLALTSRVMTELFLGRFSKAAALVTELRALMDVTGGEAALAPYGEVSLVAAQGHEDTAAPVIDQCLADVTARGEGVGINVTQWARAVLYNGLGRYGEALSAARASAEDWIQPGPPKWALAELVEAAVYARDLVTARAAMDRLSDLTEASGTEWALGLRASRRALLADGGEADALHREAIERLGATTVRLELARARLLYGEFLRRGARRVDARTQLRAAHEAFTDMGSDAFAARAGRELLATGETARKRTVDTSEQLTPQEAAIADLAAEGKTNAEIGAALYISPRTVEWHLRKVYGKLHVTTRRELRSARRTSPAV